MPDIQKAAKIYPPETQVEVIDVDMTKYHYAMVALSVTTTGLTAATGYLWYRLRKNEQYMDALKEYISRLVQTDCGMEAYNTFLDDVDEDHEPENHLYEDYTDEVADFSDHEPIPYEIDEEKAERVILRNARDIRPDN